MNFAAVGSSMRRQKSRTAYLGLCSFTFAPAIFAVFGGCQLAPYPAEESNKSDTCVVSEKQKSQYSSVGFVQIPLVSSHETYMSLRKERLFQTAMTFVGNHATYNPKTFFLISSEERIRDTDEAFSSIINYYNDEGAEDFFDNFNRALLKMQDEMRCVASALSNHQQLIANRSKIHFTNSSPTPKAHTDRHYAEDELVNQRLQNKWIVSMGVWLEV